MNHVERQTALIRGGNDIATVMKMSSKDSEAAIGTLQTGDAPPEPTQPTIAIPTTPAFDTNAAIAGIAVEKVSWHDANGTPRTYGKQNKPFCYVRISLPGCKDTGFNLFPE